MLQEVSPRIAIIGPIIIDSKSSGGEGEKLYRQLLTEGYTVHKRSGYRNKLLRLLDTIYFILRYRRSYDVAVLMLFSGNAIILEYIAVVLLRLTGKKTIGVIHGGAMADFYRKRPNITTSVFNKCNRLASPSKFLQQYFIARGWQVHDFPNFIDQTYFPFDWVNPITPKLLWVRAFHDIYNPELAIRCIAHLKQYYPNISLTMIGPDKGLLKHCASLITELNVQENIIITGAIPNRELSPYYTSHQIFLTTTRYESFGVALVEAASSGIPMVSTGVGEIPFMWEDGENMLIASGQEQQSFNQKVLLLLQDSALREKLSRNAKQEADKYTWNEIKSKWKVLIQS